MPVERFYANDAIDQGGSATWDSPGSAIGPEDAINAELVDPLGDSLDGLIAFGFPTIESVLGPSITITNVAFGAVWCDKNSKAVDHSLELIPTPTFGALNPSFTGPQTGSPVEDEIVSSGPGLFDVPEADWLLQPVTVVLQTNFDTDLEQNIQIDAFYMDITYEEPVGGSGIASRKRRRYRGLRAGRLRN